MTGFVTAKGLTSNPDNLHFNAESLYEFGIRYFEEYEKLQKDAPVCDISTESNLMRTEMELL